MDDFEKEFKEEYRAELIALLDECLQENAEAQAVILIHNPTLRMIRTFTANATADDAQSILTSVVESILKAPHEERMLN